jgi:hypothetical protein
MGLGRSDLMGLCRCDRRFSRSDWGLRRSDRRLNGSNLMGLSKSDWGLSRSDWGLGGSNWRDEIIWIREENFMKKERKRNLDLVFNQTYL